MNKPIILKSLCILLLFALPEIGFAADIRIDSLASQQEKQKAQEKQKIQEKGTDKKTDAKPEIKPDITTVPKARKQLRPTVVKPVITVKPIKVIKPKIKKP